jgi:hypothetical protein
MNFRCFSYIWSMANSVNPPAHQMEFIMRMPCCSMEDQLGKCNLCSPIWKVGIVMPIQTITLPIIYGVTPNIWSLQPSRCTNEIHHSSTCSKWINSFKDHHTSMGILKSYFIHVMYGNIREIDIYISIICKLKNIITSQFIYIYVRIYDM